jgi:hypothetical protein
VAAAQFGVNVIRFHGLVNGATRLVPGVYRVTVTAIPASGVGASVAVGTLRFTIVK